MKTVDLGLSEHLEKLNYLVGKITAKEVELAYMAFNPGVKFCALKGTELVDVESRSIEYPYFYSPTINASQCLAVTPRCCVMLHFNDAAEEYFSAVVESVITKEALRDDNQASTYKEMFAKTELIARCLALVYSVYGDEVPDVVFGEGCA